MKSSQENKQNEKSAKRIQAKKALEETIEEEHYGIEVPDGYVLAMTETGQHVIVPEMAIYQDKFRLVTEMVSPENVKTIELPKLLLKKHVNSNQSFKEKSTVLVTIKNNIAAIKNGVFKKAYKAAQKDKIGFQLEWLDEEDRVISKWVFEEARVCGIDFGNASLMKKEEESAFLVEIEYAELIIENVSMI